MKKAVRAIIIRDKKLLVIKRNKFGDVYYTLVGGGIHMNEDAESALVREVYEETGLDVKKARLVYIEEAGEPYGTQYVYLCQDPGGEVALQEDSDEAHISAMGQNTYEPEWLSLHEFRNAMFRSERLKLAILEGVDQGFPDEAVRLNDL